MEQSWWRLLRGNGKEAATLTDGLKEEWDRGLKEDRTISRVLPGGAEEGTESLHNVSREQSFQLRLFIHGRVSGPALGILHGKMQNNMKSSLEIWIQSLCLDLILIIMWRMSKESCSLILDLWQITVTCCHYELACTTLFWATFLDICLSFLLCSEKGTLQGTSQ